MVRITNVLLCFGSMLVVTGIALGLDFGGFMLIIASITSYSITYFILRFVRDTGYELVLEEELKQSTAKIKELESKSLHLQMELIRATDKLEMQKELVNLSKEFVFQNK